MAVQFITSDNTATNDAIGNTGSAGLVVSSGDEVIVTRDTFVGAGSNAVDVDNLAAFDFTLLGTIYSLSDAFTMTVSSNAAPLFFDYSLTLGSDAVAISNGDLGFFGVLDTAASALDAGSTVDVINNGEMSTADGEGLRFQTIGVVNLTNTGIISVGRDFGVLFKTVVDTYLFNTGTITTAETGTLNEDSAISVNIATQNTQIINAGLISGGSQAIVSDVATSEYISNRGTIIGDIDLSNISGEFRNSGDIQGLVLTNGGNDTFFNSGFVDGLLSTGSDNDTVTNAGQFTDDVNLSSGDDTYYGYAGSVVGGVINGASGNDNITGGNDDDIIEGDSGTDTINGRGGNDDITGDSDNDTINGGSGNDTIDGGSENDLLTAGAGDDVVLGGTGNDTINGNGGDDDINGGDGLDNITAGTGDDTINGAGDNDTIRAGSGNDELRGDTGSDFLFGGNDNDELSGGNDNDFLRGENGNDLLEGGLGTDDMRGGSGDDTLFGGAALDRLYGGGGADVFVYEDASASATGAIDTIFDFKQGEDVISFESFVGDFAFVGTSGFSGGGTKSIRYIDTSLGVSVRADTDGDGTEDMSITVRNLDVLTADDFFL